MLKYECKSRDFSKLSIILSIIIFSLFFVGAPANSSELLNEAGPRERCSDKDLGLINKDYLKEKIAATIRYPHANGDQSTEALIGQLAPIIHVGGLRNGMNDIVVYATGENYCGSSGCLLLIFSENHVKLIGKFYAVKTPITVFSSSHNGWHDVGIITGGGGEAISMAKILFDGRKYKKITKFKINNYSSKFNEKESEVILSIDGVGCFI